MSILKPRDKAVQDENWYISSFGQGGQKMVILEYIKGRVAGCKTVEWDQIDLTLEGEGVLDEDDFTAMRRERGEKIREIKQLPGDIGRLHKLESFLLTKTAITSIPESMSFLTRLTTLRITENVKLEHLPNAIGALVNLKYLDLHHNSLLELPFNLGKCTKLERLSAGSNQLTSIPDSFGNLVNLKDLILPNNKIRSFPSTLSTLIALKRVDISKNSVTFLPEMFTNMINLIEFDASFNNLVEIPNSICDCLALQYLRISNNSLVCLPMFIGNLQDLVELEIKRNKLTALPDDFLRLIKLGNLDISDNPMLPPDFKIIPSESMMW